MPRDAVSYNTWPWPPHRGPPAPTTNHPRPAICSGRGDAQYGVPYGTDGSWAGEWPWNAYTRRASRRQGTRNERKKQDMGKTPIEIELDHFWAGTAHYEPFGFSDEHAEAATKVFLDRNIVIARGETCDGNPEECSDGSVSAGSGPEYASVSGNENPNWLRNKARNYLTLADYLEARDAIRIEREAEAAQDRRRDELAQEFTAVNSYAGQLPYTQNLINRIIELEGATK